MPGDGVRDQGAGARMTDVPSNEQITIHNMPEHETLYMVLGRTAWVLTYNEAADLIRDLATALAGQLRTVPGESWLAAALRENVASWSNDPADYATWLRTPRGRETAARDLDLLPLERTVAGLTHLFRNPAPGHRVDRIWGRRDDATSNQGSAGNAWERSPAELAHAVLAYRNKVDLQRDCHLLGICYCGDPNVNRSHPYGSGPVCGGRAREAGQS